MRPTAFDWVMTVVPGLVTGALVLVMGGPWWAAVAFATVVAEVRQVTLRVREAMALPDDSTTQALAALHKAMKGSKS